MVGFIILGHGEFATGMYSACKLVDKTYSNVKAIDFLDSDSIYELDNKIKLVLEELRCYEDIIVFCDLFSGSPFKLSLINSIYDCNRFTILSGVNLPIVLEGIMIGQYNKCNAVKLVKTLKNEFPNTLVHMLN
ncbi:MULTISPECIES: PTS fructose transporter subunit IIA [unclassified Clostridium]|uniref:PTS sugar transporter subunit IIA domain-containing protein n=1 Tax=unclassified Clostridium TaxID=2614128 RepID=UPI001899A02F|nr:MULTISPECIES: PTS fructose transporter subunit IIA [unclassified Clostridium]MCR1952644.1 PTS fructose transporter subunit IIA [Clostridium sp. DSM 100503]